MLDAAEAAFGSRGYFETSIVDITRRARVAMGTFYVYFPGKRAIFSELVRERNRDLRRTIQQAVASLDDRREVERVGFQTFFRFIRRHRNMYRIVRQAEFVDPRLFRWWYDRVAQGYVRGLQEAMGRQEIRRLDPEVLAYCLMGIGDFLGMRWVLWERHEPRPPVVQAMMDFILRGIDAGSLAAADRAGEPASAGSTSSMPGRPS
ncbi:MAG: TetR/AcrR family transcriptional regulator [Armatimonadetes bacterium]|nr:TetR/AcrR family transcriptional regulator [Armatimonadota bacterium]